MTLLSFLFKRRKMKTTLIVLGTLFFITVLLIFRPVPIPPENKCLVVKGTVASIYEGGVKDAVFTLDNHPTRYYINRGLENGLYLDSLKKNLIGKTVTILYPKYYTPLDHENRIKHLCKLEHDGEVIYNELKN